LREVFKLLEDRSSRYVPLLIKLFPTPETRPRQQEVLIEAYEKAKLAAVSPLKIHPGFATAFLPSVALYLR
jgi:hypothetical protein